MKALNNIERIQISNSVLISLMNLYEEKGKTFYYDNLFRKDKEVRQILNKKGRVGCRNFTSTPFWVWDSRPVTSRSGRLTTYKIFILFFPI